ncbi:MAG: hypothetical protein ACOC85_04020, partial [Thermoplasmatota archaeon]
MKSRRTYELISKRELFWFIISLTLFLLFITLTITELGEPEPTSFWYISELYLSFWPGIVFGIIAVLISVKHGCKERIISILILVLYLYSLPSILHDMVVVFDVYHVIPPALSIVREGIVDIQRLQFPLSHIFYASNFLVLEIDGMTYAKIFPTILSSFITLSIFIVARKINKKWAVIA